MRVTIKWLLTATIVSGIGILLAACTKEGDTIYQPDPSEPKASSAPLVTVIYGTDAVGGVNAAGIGGGEDGTSGPITIYGGKVRAYGGDYGAGIGSGMDASCNSIKFYGGDVEAYSGYNAAGIGTGHETYTGPNIYSGNIYFYGGNIYVEADKGDGAAIGAGHEATCGWIYIYGGTVTAHGHSKGPWSGAFGSYCDEHGPSHRCEYESCGWNRIVVGKCMRLHTWTAYNGYWEHVSYTANWWDYVHGRSEVIFEECNHVDGAYDITNCPYCHSYTLTLQ